MFTNHVLQRTVVLPDLRVLFLPVPKAGCTSVLWLLSDLAGIPRERFTRSSLSEVTPALTVHDMGRWAPHRLADFEGAERERVLHEDGWLRFSLVRDPLRRLWSAWHTKLLLREPRFLDAFGDQPWFPRMPERPADLIEDFRRFVAALPTGTAEDVHWAVQHDLVGQLPLTHVGRLERFDETLAVLRAHVGDAWPGDPARENRSRLPMPTDAYDAAHAEILRERYGKDLEAYGYELPEPVADPGWGERVAPLLPLLRDMTQQHARIGQLHRRLRREERWTPSRPAAGGLTNLEGHADYDVPRPEGDLAPGFTGVVRVRNEARSLPFVLPPLLRAVERLVLIDNRSTDGTADVARRVAAEAGAADRLEVLSYPFAVARCGAEHLATPADSVHSLAYFYNWSFSHVRTAYALKWDGDMVLTDAAVAVLRGLAWQLEAVEAVIRIPRHPLYVADDRLAFLDMQSRNYEPWGWPNRPEQRFVKAMEWELPLWYPEASVTLPERSCVELKFIDADEFDHWSDTDFGDSRRTRRKQREYEVFTAIASGAEPPTGVVRIEVPAGEHVIDYVRSRWLPADSVEPAPAAMQRMS